MALININLSLHGLKTGLKKKTLKVHKTIISTDNCKLSIQNMRLHVQLNSNSANVSLEPYDNPFDKHHVAWCVFMDWTLCTDGPPVTDCATPCCQPRHLTASIQTKIWPVQKCTIFHCIPKFPQSDKYTETFVLLFSPSL